MTKALVLLAGAAVMACGADPGPVGVWVVDPALGPRIEEDVAKAGLGEEAARDLVDSVMNGEITFGADGVHVMTTERSGRPLRAEGTWERDGATVRVEILIKDGVRLPTPDRREMTFADGELRWQGEAPFEMVFVRKR